MKKYELTAIRMIDDISVVVPDSLNLVSPYVLREQEAWFEVETRFVRNMISPGMTVIDIGANYGLYTLMVASLLRESGHVWAFEPASDTASCLLKSVECNALLNVTVVKAALSDVEGTSKLALHDNSEMNNLTSDFGVQSETVRTTTLDECRSAFGWRGVDFIKLDAEGEESNILAGGKQLLQNESPLVMFEIRHVTWNLQLVSQFRALNYAPYRLVAGLNVLVPFDEIAAPDPFQLNLFCCKSVRAEALWKAGLLIREQDVEINGEELKYPQWHERLLDIPFARKLSRDGKCARSHDEKDQPYYRALELYFQSRSEQCTMLERYNALRQAARLFESMECTGDGRMAQRSTFARVCGDLGAREQQIKILYSIIDELPRSASSKPLILDLPFVPACPRFEQIGDWAALIDWFAAGVLEQLELSCAFSSYYMDPPSIDRLEIIRKLGFQSAEMERRRQLVSMRFLNQPAPVASPVLAVKSDENRNPEYWLGLAAGRMSTFH